MFDTYVTIVGNVLTTPEWRRTTQSNTLVANFKVASTARRLDRDSGRWVDGNSLRVRVNCWRKLAEGVASSVMVGDPVVVVGRLYTRDWTDDAGNHRTVYELEAVAVGHDLSRGRARFLRNRPSMATSTVEDAEAESRVHGEPTERVPQGQAPASPDNRPFDEDFERNGFDPARVSFDAPSAGRGLPGGPVAVDDSEAESFVGLRVGSLRGWVDDADEAPDDPEDDGGLGDGEDLDELSDVADPLSPLPADAEQLDGVEPAGGAGQDEPEPSAGESGGAPAKRGGRRAGGRVPVPA
ncbi:single-stranded DNA-binding protein [Micromonospora olivasterospora]|uniref:Single-stranded DNA-binding protein n=1 Tax=Micromonospora olivasterospora TaxID=1880 RepID=A0A562I574_MICOL|nr:single-stranded DNA-binding protein [Micromonospora olivasterospora]TWH66161.1 single-strand DNA-binding protein [Micromonospora olivasterospora]